MAEEVASPRSPGSPTGHGLRRALTVDESAQFRRRPSRFSTGLDALDADVARRRSSNLSEYSLSEVRKQFQSSTDDILLPRANIHGQDPHTAPSPWHSAPLAFALLPAIGGILFQNGSAVVTDIMLLGLAAIFLNWSVRIPWDWYHSAQAIRRSQQYNEDIVIDEDSGEENSPQGSKPQGGNAPEDISSEEPKHIPPQPRPQDKAAKELHIHELLALASCFISPIIGAYLLHSIRCYLSRPSEGLVSNYNLTIFLLASELRPISHMVKLIQARTLYLQRITNSNPNDNIGSRDRADVEELARRLEELEAHTMAGPAPAPNSSEPMLNGKQTAVVSTEVRRALQPELDALNRAVRRYEKRATLQTMQTESRLLDLEARLADAISLAAAAAQNSQRTKYGLWNVLVEWIASSIILPLQAFGALASLPFKTMMALRDFGRAMIFRRPLVDKGRNPIMGKAARAASHGRLGTDRLQSKGLKR